ncbi:hypothetical protein ACI65C_013632 [Semiaphis heraclei]
MRYRYITLGTRRTGDGRGGEDEWPMRRWLGCMPLAQWTSTDSTYDCYFCIGEAHSLSETLGRIQIITLMESGILSSSSSSDSSDDEELYSVICNGIHHLKSKVKDIFLRNFRLSRTTVDRIVTDFMSSDYYPKYTAGKPTISAEAHILMFLWSKSTRYRCRKRAASFIDSTFSANNEVNNEDDQRLPPSSNSPFSTDSQPISPVKVNTGLNLFDLNSEDILNHSSSTDSSSGHRP